MRPILEIRRLFAVTDRLAAIEAKIDELAAQVSTAHEQPSSIDQPTAISPTQDLGKQLESLKDILQVIYDREPEMRERLSELRSQPDYETAFVAREPLVSVVIPTYDRGELLIERAIPSVLAQSYGNLEIVVVGDCAPESTARKLAAFDDPRITYRNLPYRGPYPRDPRDLWHVAGIPPRNLAVSLARGQWVAPLDDDDAFHPNHVQLLLALARSGQYEVAYGPLRCLMRDGTEFTLGTYPPEIGHFGWQSAIFHAGLRFFEMELADALFFTPADWSLCRRMLRAGVRFGMLDDVLTDHYESRFAPRFD